MSRSDEGTSRSTASISATLGLLGEIVVSIVHTEEGEHIHIVSMRKATKRERKIYSESIAN